MRGWEPRLFGRLSRGAFGRAVEIDKNLHVVGDVYDTGKGQVVVPEPGQP